MDTHEGSNYTYQGGNHLQMKLLFWKAVYVH
jgi:hypothetical protein